MHVDTAGYTDIEPRQRQGEGRDWECMQSVSVCKTTSLTGCLASPSSLHL